MRAEARTSTRAEPLTASGQNCWPPTGSFVTAYGQDLMAADKTAGSYVTCLCSTSREQSIELAVARLPEEYGHARSLAACPAEPYGISCGST